MAKLLLLSSGFTASIAPNVASSILRDIHRNDTSPRRYVYVSDTPEAPGSKKDQPMATLGSIGANNSIAVYHVANAIDKTNGTTVAINIEKVQNKYKVSIPSIASLDTAAKVAAAAFGDQTRTSFDSLQDFVKALSNSEYLRGLIQDGSSITEIAAVVVDQIDTEAFLVDSNFTGSQNLSHVASVQFDEPVSVQFGE